MYDGTHASVMRISRRFGIERTQVAYMVNHRNRREVVKRSILKWMRANKDKVAVYTKRAKKKWLANPENRAKWNAYMRDYMRKRNKKLSQQKHGRSAKKRKS